MTALIQRALDDNPSLAATATRVDQAYARRTAVRASLFPNLDYGGSRNARRNWVNNGPDTVSTTYSADLSASWEIDLFGKNRNALAAATADTETAEELLNSAHATLASDTAQAYIDLRNLEERLTILTESIQTRQEATDIAKWRAEAGQTDELEYNQALSALEAARSQISSLKESIAQTKNRIAVLCGANPGTVDTGIGPIPSPAQKLAVGIPADVIRQRPDVRAAGYNWVAAVARIRSAEAERLPSLRLSGDIGITALHASKIFNPEMAAASLITGLTGPLFDAGRIRANIDAQSAAADEALLNYQANVISAMSEVENALIACKRTAERIASLQKAAVAAREAASLASMKYSAGVSDMTTLLDAQRSELSVRESLASARADRATAYVQLYKALGGGW